MHHLNHTNFGNLLPMRKAKERIEHCSCTLNILRQGLKVQSETMPCDAVLRYVAFGSERVLVESARQHGHFVMW